MNRRHFIKWLVAGFAILAGGIGAILKFAGKENEQAVDPGLSKKTQQTPAPHPDPSSSAKPKGSGLPLFSFFLLSDLHVNADINDPSDHLKLALEDIKQFETPVQSVVFGGDLTEYGRDSDYKELEKVLSGYKLPVTHANMGNHDYYDIWIDQSGAFNREAMPNGKTDANSRNKFLKFMGYDKPYNDAWINGVHLIMLSQETYVQEKPEVGEGAWYSDEQLDWLKEKMAEHKDGKPAFVMIHQGLPAIGKDGGSHSLIRAKMFREILKPYPNTFVFSGHGHRDFNFVEDHYVKETFHWFINSSVGRVLNRKYQHEMKDSAQGIYMEVFDDKVVLRGREFSNRTWVKGAQWTIPLA